MPEPSCNARRWWRRWTVKPYRFRDGTLVDVTPSRFFRRQRAEEFVRYMARFGYDCELRRG